jgi:5-methylcytosine-specific restriction enzyme subunit McrC
MNHFLREYDTIIDGSRSGWNGTEFRLETTAFLELVALLEQNENLKDIATFTRVRGKNAVKFKQWVGLIRLPCGVTLEILPKTHQFGDSPESSRALLVRMLTRTDQRFRVAPPADLDPAQMPLLEIFLQFALAGFQKALRRGIPHTYVRVEEVRSNLRGRLQIKHQMRQPVHRKHLLHVAYDEYLANRPENRLVRSSLEGIVKLTQNANTKRIARQTLGLLEDVPVSINIKADFSSWRLERGYSHFAGLERLCQLVLFELNPLIGGENAQGISLLFDMNRLFEAYVAQLLKDQHPDWLIRTQATELSLGDIGGQRVFKLKPDLLITLPSGEVIVADTKWKRLKSEASGYYGVSQADVYQMLAYRLTYQAKQSHSRLWLLYPSVPDIPPQLNPIALPQNTTLEICQLVL